MNHDGDVLAADSLRPYLGECVPEVARFGLRLAFDDPTDLASTAGGAAAVLLPATTPSETGQLRHVRAGHFLLPIVGVVCDRTGHQTYHALSAGATTVLNLMLPAQHRLDALHSALAQRPTATGTLRAVASPCRDEPAPPDARESGARETEVLIDLLCGPQTVSTIARRFFCSERSMYRRIRRLYDDVGVAGRAELRVAVALGDPLAEGA